MPLAAAIRAEYALRSWLLRIYHGKTFSPSNRKQSLIGTDNRVYGASLSQIHSDGQLEAIERADSLALLRPKRAQQPFRFPVMSNE